MKKNIAVMMSLLLTASLLGGCGNSGSGTTAAPTEAGTKAAVESTAAEVKTEPAGNGGANSYPERDLKAMIGYGAGGATDMAVRPLFTAAEKLLGSSIVVENTAGASGSTSWLAACEAAPDGYTLCIGAETPALYDAYDLIQYTYDDVIPIMVVSEAVQTITVAADSPYQTVKDLFQADIDNPGSVLKVASGKVGINGTLSAIWKTAAGFDPGTYTSDGASSSIVTVLGGFADFCVSSTAAVQSYKDSGDVRVLCTNSVERYWDDVPAIVEDYPEMEKYLPLGAFYTICVPADTDPEVVAYLTDVFTQAYNSDEFQQSLKDQGLSGLGLTGEEAKKFLDEWRHKALLALTESGVVEKTMKDLGYDE
ncbi:tripartite tricarboxylate transporter substrate binding protein [Hominifimenecus sp. rT4P-3]|uniref:tripartite tricarboxylate transporter substrate binding protein n=1 Tax=Hominifimenecus sp. rT4P-3 TaxID=3242979 RepID=UPI003DA1CF1D